ncbi:acetyl-CoA carboxylase carboxyl transferase subunit alpha/beta [Thermodesulfatator autotrophicus]|uniref:Acetyl-coenzyme A carboxylase carboxyl transferase subunits beta/alpha n=1 Tax=Thermodesulfatator autotrophicus TaxID=1795632 RepID=A0A177E680_9BACT|nr:acetyl-CoA carboxylase carboxyl transferase subunit alpha/beta [Thermodesulfatator autotrophicus]OAG26732.1 acetyl-CoA carboxylase carboxyl transferase subunit alpha/beta [Thermodesulfatator autotrophicus]
MRELQRYLNDLIDRIIYLQDIKGEDWEGLPAILSELNSLKENFYQITEKTCQARLEAIDNRLSLLEEQADKTLTPYETVKIVRNPQRFTLLDILENVYDSFTELGGEGEINVDPAVICARAMISRRVGDKIYMHQVIVIGHEKGHGEEFRNGGSAKPWGNEKALRYMRVAETEGIPIHFYVFTPGAFPIEDYPGAAQQIARNLYFMSKLKVPTVAFISEGGSGGAEAIALSDVRLMAAYGYYSVISPEGAAAIEGKLKEGQRPPRDLVEFCARQLKITAKDNLRLGTIDRIVPEPPLGARRNDYQFFKRLRYEMIRATDEAVLRTKSLKAFRSYALKRKSEEENPPDEFDVYVRWELSDVEIEKLLDLRSKKYREMSRHVLGLKKSPLKNYIEKSQDLGLRVYHDLRYGFLKQSQKMIQRVMEDISGEGFAFLKQLTEPLKSTYDLLGTKGRRGRAKPVVEEPVIEDVSELYVSPLALEDRTVTCPNAEKFGCQDIWVPDLYGEFCGVCPTCGYHFPLEYQWYLSNVFDANSIKEFNAHIASTNPLGFEGFDKKLALARKKTGRNSAMITFQAKIGGISLIVAMLIADFRQGTVGAAEGEKFIQACDRARITKRPFLAFIHTTGGIRIHEGTLGVIQMPRCTLAVREYIDEGGLYLVVYDNNSYAGPVASFLGCSPYQFAIRSTRLGFAGPRVIRETTGEDIPPDYHSAENALRRGHIQGIWDRREIRKKLYEALLTMGGKNLYYR